MQSCSYLNDFGKERILNSHIVRIWNTEQTLLSLLLRKYLINIKDVTTFGINLGWVEEQSKYLKLVQIYLVTSKSNKNNLILLQISIIEGSIKSNKARFIIKLKQALPYHCMTILYLETQAKLYKSNILLIDMDFLLVYLTLRKYWIKLSLQEFWTFN